MSALRTVRAEDVLRRLPPRAGRGRDWYRVEAGADEAAVFIYDVIGWPFVTADEFVGELRALDAPRITLHLNSPGGDVFDGIAIHNALRDHAAEVEVRVDGVAASIASVVAMAGDRVVMNRHSTLMVHDPWGLTVGDAADHRKQAEVLEQLAGTIAGVYAERAGGSASEWRARMLEESWYTDRGAVEAGLADAVAGETPAAEGRFDLSVFRNTPDHLRRPALEGERAVSKREAERALRDAGLPARAARAVLSGGWDELGRNARDARALQELAASMRIAAGEAASNGHRHH